MIYVNVVLICCPDPSIFMRNGASICGGYVWITVQSCLFWVSFSTDSATGFPLFTRFVLICSSFLRDWAKKLKRINWKTAGRVCVCDALGERSPLSLDLLKVNLIMMISHIFGTCLSCSVFKLTAWSSISKVTSRRMVWFSIFQIWTVCLKDTCYLFVDFIMVITEDSKIDPACLLFL